MSNAIRQFIVAVDGWLEASERFGEARRPFILADDQYQPLCRVDSQGRRNTCQPERDDGTDPGSTEFAGDFYPDIDETYTKDEYQALVQRLHTTRQEAHQRRQAVLAASQPAAVQLVRQGADATGAAHVARLARDPSFAGPAAVRELWNHVAAGLDVAAIAADAQPDVEPVVQVQGDVKQAGQVKPDVVEPDAIPDGPFAGDRFGYAGKQYELTGKPWLLLRELWNARHNTRDFDELAEPVWRDHNEMVTIDQVKSLQGRLRLFFEKHKLPLKTTISGQAKTIRLILLKG